MPRRHPRRAFPLACCLAASWWLTGCGGNSPAAPSPTPNTSPAPIQNFCTVALEADAGQIGAEGATLRIQVEAPPGCAWTASTSSSFLSIVAGRSGNGAGEIEIAVAANTGPERSGTILVGSATVAVTQRAGVPPPGPAPVPPSPPAPEPCTFTVSPLTLRVAADGGEVSVDVRVQGVNCRWSAVPGVPFVSTLGPLDRTSSGTATIVVEKNSGPARTGTAIVAGQTVTLEQDAVAPTACVYSVSPLRASLPVSGGLVTFTVTVTQGANCAWTTQTIGDAMAIVSGAHGVGNGTVSVSVGPNPGTQRWGGVIIAGEHATIYQPEAPGACVFTVSPSAFSITAAAQKIVFDVTVTGTAPLPQCQFSVSHERTMFHTESLTPSGNTTRAVVVVGENPSTSARTGIVWVAGMVNPIQIQVVQAGRSPVP